MSSKQKNRNKSEIRERNQADDDNEDVYERYNSVRYEEYNEQDQRAINRIITCCDISKTKFFWLIIMFVMIISGAATGLIVYFVLITGKQMVFISFTFSLCTKI